MDDRVLFQTIDGAIQMGLREGFKLISQDLPTLRDQFAMSVLPRSANHQSMPWAMIAEDAYTAADAMLLARQRNRI